MMVHLKDGGEPKNVPLVTYDTDGNRIVLGEATVALRQGQLRVVGVFNDIPELGSLTNVEMESLSIVHAELPLRGGPPPQPPSDAQIGGAFRRYMEGKLNE